MGISFWGILSSLPTWLCATVGVRTAGGGQEQHEAVCLDYFVHILLCGLAKDKGLLTTEVGGRDIL